MISWAYILKSNHFLDINPKGKSCRIRQDLKLSCWKFSLNHLASWWKLSWSSEIIKDIKYLEFFLSLENLDFCWLSWLLMIKFDIFKCLDESWSLKFNVDQKVKVWLLLSIDFLSVGQISTINPLILRNELNYEIRSKLCIWIDHVSNQ